MMQGRTTRDVRRRGLLIDPSELGRLPARIVLHSACGRRSRIESLRLAYAGSGLLLIGETDKRSIQSGVAPLGARESLEIGENHH